jgi:hypothetical protein
MLRWFVRFVGLWLVAGALVAAVVDGAKSIGASRLVLTSVAETWTTMAEFGEAESVVFEPPSAPWPLDILLDWLYAAPSAAVLAVLGFLLLVAGQRPRRPQLGPEFAA